MKVPRSNQLGVKIKDDLNYKFTGFRDQIFPFLYVMATLTLRVHTLQDVASLTTFFQSTFGIAPKEKQLSVSGRNWGEVDLNGKCILFALVLSSPIQFVLLNFVGNILTFLVGSKQAFEQYPYTNDSFSWSQKDSLMVISFHIPNSNTQFVGDENRPPAQVFRDKILSMADVGAGGEESVVTFEGIAILTPRGWYNVELHLSFLRLQGQANDFKIQFSSVVHLFLLPKILVYSHVHKAFFGYFRIKLFQYDSRFVNLLFHSLSFVLQSNQPHSFVVVTLAPPIRKGQTLYPHIVLQFETDCVVESTLSMNKDLLNAKYKDKLEPTYKGLIHEVFVLILCRLSGAKVTRPGKFRSCQDGYAVKSSLKAEDGVLYPLEKGFFFYPSLQLLFFMKSLLFFTINMLYLWEGFDLLHILFQIDYVDFERHAAGGSNMHYFDLLIRLKTEQEHLFWNIQRSEYHNLFDFISGKGSFVASFLLSTALHSVEQIEMMAELSRREKQANIRLKFAEMRAELSRREKQSNIKPDPEIYIFMKILDLELCVDTLVGDVIHGGKTLLVYNRNPDPCLSFPSFYPHISFEPVTLHGLSLELGRRDHGAIHFTTPAFIVKSSSRHGGKTLLVYNRNPDPCLSFPSFYPHISFEPVTLHGLSLELGRRDHGAIHFTTPSFIVRRCDPFPGRATDVAATPVTLHGLSLELGRRDHGAIHFTTPAFIIRRCDPIPGRATDVAAKVAKPSRLHSKPGSVPYLSIILSSHFFGARYPPWAYLRIGPLENVTHFLAGRLMLQRSPFTLHGLSLELGRRDHGAIHFMTLAFIVRRCDPFHSRATDVAATPVLLHRRSLESGRRDHGVFHFTTPTFIVRRFDPFPGWATDPVTLHGRSLELGRRDHGAIHFTTPAFIVRRCDPFPGRATDVAATPVTLHGLSLELGRRDHGAIHSTTPAFIVRRFEDVTHFLTVLLHGRSLESGRRDHGVFHFTTPAFIVKSTSWLEDVTHFLAGRLMLQPRWPVLLHRRSLESGRHDHGVFHFTTSTFIVRRCDPFLGWATDVAVTPVTLHGRSLELGRRDHSAIHFTTPAFTVKSSSCHGGKTLLVYIRNLDPCLIFPSFYPHISLKPVTLHGLSLELGRRDHGAIHFTTTAFIVRRLEDVTHFLAGRLMLQPRATDVAAKMGKPSRLHSKPGSVPYLSIILSSTFLWSPFTLHGLSLELRRRDHGAIHFTTPAFIVRRCDPFHGRATDVAATPVLLHRRSLESGRRDYGIFHFTTPAFIVRRCDPFPGWATDIAATPVLLHRRSLESGRRDHGVFHFTTSTFIVRRCDPFPGWATDVAAMPVLLHRRSLESGRRDHGVFHFTTSTFIVRRCDPFPGWATDVAATPVTLHGRSFELGRRDHNAIHFTTPAFIVRRCDPFPGRATDVAATVGKPFSSTFGT
ncbi:hypothetical protein RHSIM_Rhsim05G0106500 [Rhododendron simsii]|uniref:Histone chaperone RTT106/FACT complex subunit SPT16-like middle domain-containing protein n=1 Tax=Rhododendron simsii TaxID=118357 RepID=A0A834GY79_RHOSS|nr:hypothetical protein RHSIM_Rhsim05G0106500 [Rhododendron simsii]